MDNLGNIPVFDQSLRFSSAEMEPNDSPYYPDDDNLSPTSGYPDFENESFYQDSANGFMNWTNETMEDFPYSYSLGFSIVIAILYNSVFITALLGNALVCYVVFSSTRMRTVTNYFIVNLAVGDLLMACFCVPFSYIPVLLQYWPFGHVLCYLLPPIQAIGVLISSYTLVALAVDRYMAILYPLRPRIRRSQACWVIAVIWLIAVITASPLAVFMEYVPSNHTSRYLCDESGWETMGVGEFKLVYGLALLILQYFFPLVVLIFTYSRIAMAVWGKKSLGEAEEPQDQRIAKTKRKTVVMSLMVVAGYTLAWLPLNLMVIVGFDNVSFYPQYVFFACHLLAMAHSTYNPVIYAWMNVKFRTAFLSVLSRLNLLCPCLLNFCLSNSSSPTNTTNQYPFSHHHHSLYYHQQIYGNSAHGSNKLHIHQNNHPTNQSNTKKRAYQLTNGSVKSTVDSDPLVLITIPTHQILAKANANANQRANGGGPIKEERTKTQQLSTEILNVAVTNPPIIPPSKKSVVAATGGGEEKTNGMTVVSALTNNTGIVTTTSPPTPKILTSVTLDKSGGCSSPTVAPVDIMTTAKDDDLRIEDEDDLEIQSPVWT